MMKIFIEVFYIEGGDIMKQYAYPAIFVAEEEGRYSVFFPDLRACCTCGDNLAHALFMAQDVLSFWLMRAEDEGKDFPEPSPAEKIKVPVNGFVNFVLGDTEEYRKKLANPEEKEMISK